MYIMDGSNTNDAEYDGAGISLDYADERIMSTCLSASAAIAEIASFIYNTGDGTGLECLQSVVAIHPIMGAAAVQLWAQYTRHGSDCNTTIQTYKENVALFATIIKSWKSQWKVAVAFDETLDSVERLYEFSYKNSPWDSAGFGGAGEDDVTEAANQQLDIESRTMLTGNTAGVAEGSGLPDPEQVCQRLFDKIRYTMLVSLEAPDVKRRMLNAYLKTLWIHVWKSTATDDFVVWEQ